MAVARLHRNNFALIKLFFDGEFQFMDSTLLPAFAQEKVDHYWIIEELLTVFRFVLKLVINISAQAGHPQFIPANLNVLLKDLAFETEVDNYKNPEPGDIKTLYFHLIIRSYIDFDKLETYLTNKILRDKFYTAVAAQLNDLFKLTLDLGRVDQPIYLNYVNNIPGLDPVIKKAFQALIPSTSFHDYIGFGWPLLVCANTLKQKELITSTILNHTGTTAFIGCRFTRDRLDDSVACLQEKINKYQSSLKLNLQLKKALFDYIKSGYDLEIINVLSANYKDDNGKIDESFLSFIQQLRSINLISRISMRNLLLVKFLRLIDFTLRVLMHTTDFMRQELAKGKTFSEEPEATIGLQQKIVALNQEDLKIKIFGIAANPEGGTSYFNIDLLNYILSSNIGYVNFFTELHYAALFVLKILTTLIAEHPQANSIASLQEREDLTKKVVLKFDLAGNKVLLQHQPDWLAEMVTAKAYVNISEINKLITKIRTQESLAVSRQELTNAYEHVKKVIIEIWQMRVNNFHDSIPTIARNFENVRYQIGKDARKEMLAIINARQAALSTGEIYGLLMSKVKTVAQKEAALEMIESLTKFKSSVKYEPLPFGQEGVRVLNSAKAEYMARRVKYTTAIKELFYQYFLTNFSSAVLHGFFQQYMPETKIAAEVRHALQVIDRAPFSAQKAQGVLIFINDIDYLLKAQTSLYHFYKQFECQTIMVEKKSDKPDKPKTNSTVARSSREVIVYTPPAEGQFAINLLKFREDCARLQAELLAQQIIFRQLYRQREFFQEKQIIEIARFAPIITLLDDFMQKLDANEVNADFTYSCANNDELISKIATLKLLQKEFVGIAEKITRINDKTHKFIEHQKKAAHKLRIFDASSSAARGTSTVAVTQNGRRLA